MILVMLKARAASCALGLSLERYEGAGVARNCGPKHGASNALWRGARGSELGKLNAPELFCSQALALRVHAVTEDISDGHGASWRRPWQPLRWLDLSSRIRYSSLIDVTGNARATSPLSAMRTAPPKHEAGGHFSLRYSLCRVCDRGATSSGKTRADSSKVPSGLGPGR